MSFFEFVGLDGECLVGFRRSVFGLKTWFFGVCALVPFFAITRTFEQKCGVLRDARCAAVRAGFELDWAGFRAVVGLGDCALVRAWSGAKGRRCGGLSWHCG